MKKETLEPAAKQVPGNTTTVVVSKSFDSEDSKLYGELLDFFKVHLDLVDERHYHVLACYALLIERFRQFRAIPYITAIGVPGSGKSLVLGLFKELFDSEAVEVAGSSDAYLFRKVGLVKVMLLDEWDKTSVDKQQSLTSILDVGYKFNGSVGRCHPKTNAPEEFNVYGPKIIASEKEPAGTILSRSIILQMREGFNHRYGIDYVRAQTLAAGLHDYEQRHLVAGSSKTYSPQEWGFNRLSELFEPLYQVAPTSEAENALALLCRDLGEERKIYDASSLDAVYVKAIKAHVDQAGTLDSGGIVTFTMDDILPTVKSLVENEWVAKQQTGFTIARRLRVLGWHPKHTKNGNHWEMVANEYKALLGRFQL